MQSLRDGKTADNNAEAAVEISTCKNGSENKELYVLKHLFYYKCVFHFFRYVLGYPVKWIYRFKCKKYKIRSSHFLMLANHTMNIDPIFEAVALKRHMKFVANEAVLQYGWEGKAVKFLQNPIPKRKGANASDTVELIKEYLRNGVSVAMHAEGNRSYTGETGFISPRTGELVKNAASGGLITFRTRGGYMRSPRWAKHSRRGPLFGAVVNEYTREEIDKMTVYEINEVICRDLYTDAYDEQRRHMDKYKGRALAESLETALYICPCCRGISTMHSSEDLFTCSKCSYEVKINEYGFFELRTPGKDSDSCAQKSDFLDTVKDWDKWQREYIAQNLDIWKNHIPEIEKPIVSDGGMVLTEVFHNETSKIISSNCRIELYGDRLRAVFDTACSDGAVNARDEIKYCSTADSGSVGFMDFMLSDISRLAINARSGIVFTCRDNFFKLKSDKVYSNLKYFAFYRYLTGRKYV